MVNRPEIYILGQDIAQVDHIIPIFSYKRKSEKATGMICVGEWVKQNTLKSFEHVERKVRR